MNPLIKKKAKVILFPIEGKEGIIYGMNNKDGALVKFDFARASKGTYFDSIIDMKEVGVNIPRIDFGNYSADRKILIEKESTNIMLNGVEYWEQGSANEHLAVGRTYEQIKISRTNRLRTKDLVNTNKDATTVSFNSDYCHSFILLFDENGLYEEKYLGWFNSSFTLTEGASNLAMLIRKSDSPNDNINVDYISKCEIQVEKGNKQTSYIPTYGEPVTRSKDSLSINISTQSSILICDTKEKQVVDVQGLFKVEDYIQNDGLTLLAIFDPLSDSEKEIITNSNRIPQIMMRVMSRTMPPIEVKYPIFERYEYDGQDLEETEEI